MRSLQLVCHVHLLKYLLRSEVFQYLSILIRSFKLHTSDVLEKRKTRLLVKYLMTERLNCFVLLCMHFSQLRLTFLHDFLLYLLRIDLCKVRQSFQFKYFGFYIFLVLIQVFFRTLTLVKVELLFFKNGFLGNLVFGFAKR